MQPETLRTFVALPLAESIQPQLADAQRQLRKLCPEGAVRWVAPEAMHLTLFFLGDTVKERLTPIQEALTVVARSIMPFAVRAQGIGAFPNHQQPNVIWIGLDEPTGKLALLHSAVNEALASVGFTPEARPFAPHLTLGRVQRSIPREEVRRVGAALGKMEVGVLGEVTADKLIFFRSTLKTTGAEYTPLATFRLGKNA